MACKRVVSFSFIPTSNSDLLTHDCGTAYYVGDTAPFFTDREAALWQVTSAYQPARTHAYNGMSCHISRVQRQCAKDHPNSTGYAPTPAAPGPFTVLSRYVQLSLGYIRTIELKRMRVIDPTTIQPDFGHFEVDVETHGMS